MVERQEGTNKVTENRWTFWRDNSTSVLRSFEHDHEGAYDTLVRSGFVSTVESLIVAVQLKTIRDIKERSRIPDRTFKDDKKGFFKQAFDSPRRAVEKELYTIEQELQQEAWDSGMGVEKELYTIEQELQQKVLGGRMRKQESGEASVFWPKTAEDRKKEDQLPVRSITVKVEIDSFEGFETRWSTNNQDLDFIFKKILPLIMDETVSYLLKFSDKYTEGVLHPDKLWQNWQEDLEKIISLCVQEDPVLGDFFNNSGWTTDLIYLISSIQLETAEGAIRKSWVLRDNPYAWPHHIARGQINWELERVGNELRRAHDKIKREKKRLDDTRHIERLTPPCPDGSEEVGWFHKEATKYFDKFGNRVYRTDSNKFFYWNVQMSAGSMIPDEEIPENLKPRNN